VPIEKQVDGRTAGRSATAASRAAAGSRRFGDHRPITHKFAIRDRQEGLPMNMPFHLKTCVLAACMLMLPAVQAATMSKVDYKAGKTRISATYKSDKAACAALVSNAKDVCIEEAKAKEKVALAELEFSYTGKAKDQNKVMVAKAESAYAVAKERCDDQTGNAKDVCVKEAKAVEVKALADAKMAKEIGESKKDAAADKRDADYKVAMEKCDALSSDAKSSCVSAAKANFGKL
jgi:hypothetical protein